MARRKVKGRGPRRQLTDEQKAKMKEGRERWLADQRGRDADTQSKLAEIEATPAQRVSDAPQGVDDWTWDRVKAMLADGRMKTVRFVPDETIPIGWNGLQVWVTKGIEAEVAEPFYAVYAQSRRETREAFELTRETLAKRAGAYHEVSVGWVPEP